MKISTEELVAVLSSFNPWWKEEKIPDLPKWERGAFRELMQWIQHPPAPRALLVSGPRQVGKTTLLLQAIQHLLEGGTPPNNILYMTFDHPVCKLAGLEAVLGAWREFAPQVQGFEYIFLDEAQSIPHIGTWVKHQVDFSKSRRIVFTGSATPLLHADQESGVGRWHILRVTTLSFYEYLRIKKISLPAVPSILSLQSVFNSTKGALLHMTEAAEFLIGHFHEFLLRGGFPQTVLIDSITQAQRLLREDILERVLKRDMTATFGIRRIVELEQLFLFLCMHDGGITDITTLAKDIGIAKQTVQNYLALLESAYLVYRLPPFGYGKEVLRGKNKLYLTDPAIAPSVLMKGKSLLEDAHALSQCVETAIMGHVWAHCASIHARFSYWRNQKHKEVDLVVEIGEMTFPLEVKYQSQTVQGRDIVGLLDLYTQKPSISWGCVITKNPHDLGPLQEKTLRIPAALFCYWLGAAEFTQTNLFPH